MPGTVISNAQKLSFKVSAIYGIYVILLYIVFFVVFICDTGKECYVWIGRGASEAENKNAIPYAHVSIK